MSVRTNLVDRVVEFFSPETARRRTLARAQLAVVRSIGGRRRRSSDEDERGGWMKVGGDNTALGFGERERMRRRVRKAVANNEHATAAAEALSNYTVGWGIRPRSASGSKQADAARGKAWEAWAEGTECDWNGRASFYGLQSLVRRMCAVDGEALIRFRYVAASATLPLRLQVLRAEYLDTSRDSTLSDGGAVIGGVAFDADGRRTGYWLHRALPGDPAWGRLGTESVFVPVSECLHVFRQTESDQVRGVSEFAPAVSKLEQLADGSEAWLELNRVAACFAGAIKTNGDGGARPFEPTDGDGAPSEEPNRYSDISPATLLYLNQGEEWIDIRPPQVQGQADFVKSGLYGFAAGTRTPYHVVSKDVSQANYSSTRAALVDFRVGIERDQQELMIVQFCVPVWGEFVRMGVIGGLWRPTPAVARWDPPPFPVVELEKDIQSIVAARRDGLMTWPQAVSSMGYDPEKQAAELAEWNARHDALGIVLDGDPRKVSQQGQAQKNGKAAAADAGSQQAA